MSYERRPSLIGRRLKSDKKSNVKGIGGSDLKGCEGQGKRQVRQGCFINNGEDKEGRGCDWFKR